MELTLKEVEMLTCISRYQISRYAKQGRLQRTRQGHYEAASLANLCEPFRRYEYFGKDIDEERAVWLVRNEYYFRREISKIIDNRNKGERGGYGLPELSATDKSQINKAVKEFIKTLAARPER